MLKNPRLLLVFIIILTLLSLYIDLPKINVFNHEISHPKLQTKLITRDFEPKLGLDLSGGVQLVLSADMSKLQEQDKENALESVQNIIEARINSLGVSEPVIQKATTPGQYRLIVEIPGIQNTDEAIATVRKTAHLEFRVLSQDAPSEATIAALPQHFTASELTGSDLKRAQASASNDPQNPGYVVDLEFNEQGTKKLEQITRDHIEQPMAMFLDDQPISWPPPIIRAVIDDGHAQISGNFQAKDARSLAIALNAGALPVPLNIESQTRVGPSLGRDAIDKSILATAIGLASVIFFMIAYYRILGLFAILALGTYTILIFAIFKIIPVTLTLAGITGFILSIGMAVDANILIFERIKEEMRWGKPQLEAFFAGFDRAWSSIRDSNVSSLITTAILFNFGTGPIRGFALTLAIGILVSMFSAITVTRILLWVFWIKKI